MTFVRLRARIFLGAGLAAVLLGFAGAGLWVLHGLDVTEITDCDGYAVRKDMNLLEREVQTAVQEIEHARQALDLRVGPQAAVLENFDAKLKALTGRLREVQKERDRLDSEIRDLQRQKEALISSTVYQMVPQKSGGPELKTRRGRILTLLGSVRNGLTGCVGK